MGQMLETLMRDNDCRDGGATIIAMLFRLFLFAIRGRAFVADGGLARAGWGVRSLAGFSLFLLRNLRII